MKKRTFLSVCGIWIVGAVSSWGSVWWYAPTKTDLIRKAGLISVVDTQINDSLPIARDISTQLSQIVEILADRPSQRVIAPWKIYLLSEMISYTEIRIHELELQEQLAAEYLHKQETKNLLQRRFALQQADEWVQPTTQRDTTTDASLTKFVWVDVSFLDIWYVPDDLWTFWAWSHELREDVHAAFFSMQEAYRESTGYWFSVNSAWRSSADQQGLRWHVICRTPGRCAKPWHSEHQTGLAIDLWYMSWKNYERMKYNAHRYWFHQSYQKWSSIDGYMRENRHWRYVGVDLATLLFESWKTFTERVIEENEDVY